MLKFIITLAVIGAIAGLIFSRSGKEQEGFFKGAKSGAKLGCVICIGTVILIVIFALVIASV